MKRKTFDERENERWERFHTKRDKMRAEQAVFESKSLEEKKTICLSRIKNYETQ